MACNTKGVIYGDESWGQVSLGSVRMREKQLFVMFQRISCRLLVFGAQTQPQCTVHCVI